MSHKEITRSLLTLVMITAIAAGMLFYVVYTIKAQKQQEYITEMNLYCANLSSYINIIKNNFTECMKIYNDTVICEETPGGYDFSCYFADCPTDSSYLDQKTESLCVCDMTHQNQTTTLCIRRVK